MHKSLSSIVLAIVWLPETLESFVKIALQLLSGPSLPGYIVLPMGIHLDMMGDHEVTTWGMDLWMGLGDLGQFALMYAKLPH